jgi:hypothetical protein
MARPARPDRRGHDATGARSQALYQPTQGDALSDAGACTPKDLPRHACEKPFCDHRRGRPPLGCDDDGSGRAAGNYRPTGNQTATAPIPREVPRWDPRWRLCPVLFPATSMVSFFGPVGFSLRTVGRLPQNHTNMNNMTSADGFGYDGRVLEIVRVVRAAVS